MKVKTYAFAARPFIVTLNPRGFTQIPPSLRREPPLQNSPSALMTGRLRQVGFRAAGAAALIPSCAPSGSGSSSRLFKATLKGHAATAQVDPDAGCTDPFNIQRTPKPGSKECSFGISDFLEEILSLSHAVVFLYFFALIPEEGFSVCVKLIYTL